MENKERIKKYLSSIKFNVENQEIIGMRLKLSIRQKRLRMQKAHLPLGIWFMKKCTISR